MGISDAWLALAPAEEESDAVVAAEPSNAVRVANPNPAVVQVTRKIDLHGCAQQPYTGAGSGVPMMYQISKMKSTLDKLSDYRDRASSDEESDDDNRMVQVAALVHQAHSLR